MKFSLLTVSAAVALGTAQAGILDNVWKKQGASSSADNSQHQVRCMRACVRSFVRVAKQASHETFQTVGSFIVAVSFFHWIWVSSLPLQHAGKKQEPLLIKGQFAHTFLTFVCFPVHRITTMLPVPASPVKPPVVLRR
jgi:hypothetical protein